MDQAQVPAARLTHNILPTSALLRFPPEIFSNIVSYSNPNIISHSKDDKRPGRLCALTRTCKRLYDVGIPILYRYMQIFCGGLHPTVEDTERVSQMCFALLSAKKPGQYTALLAVYDFRSGSARSPFIRSVDLLIEFSSTLLVRRFCRPFWPFSVQLSPTLCEVLSRRVFRI